MRLLTKGLWLIAIPSIVELTLVGALSKMQEQTAEAVQWALRSKHVLYQASAMMDPLLREAARVRTAIIVGDASFIDQQGVWGDLNDRLAQLDQLVVDNARQQARVRQMREAIRVYHAHVDDIAAMLHGGAPVRLNALHVRPLAPQILAFQQALDAFVAEETHLDATRSVELAAMRGKQRIALIAAIVGSMLMWGLAACVFVRNIGRRFAILTRNAERLGYARLPGSPLMGDDEIAELDRVLHQTSARLQAAEHEQAALQKELEKRTEALTQANDDLRRQRQDNDMFVYSVSHDLRSPLVNLQVFSRELQRSCEQLHALLDIARLPEAEHARMVGVLEGSLNEALRYLSAAVARSASIIDALLRISRAGRLEYQWQQVNVARVVAQIVQRFEPVIRERQIAISIEDLPPVWGDPGAIEQLFSHLIDNAIHYLDPKRPARIEIGRWTPSGQPSERATPMLTYYVRDNGLGIPAAWIPKVFNAFQRLHSEQTKGDGVGLALARRIAQRHGGHVWVESTEGVGSTFFVSLCNEPSRASSSSSSSSSL